MMEEEGKIVGDEENPERCVQIRKVGVALIQSDARVYIFPTKRYDGPQQREAAAASSAARNV